VTFVHFPLFAANDATKLDVTKGGQSPRQNMADLLGDYEFFAASSFIVGIEHLIIICSYR